MQSIIYLLLNGDTCCTNTYPMCLIAECRSHYFSEFVELVEKDMLKVWFCSSTKTDCYIGNCVLVYVQRKMQVRHYMESFNSGNS